MAINQYTQPIDNTLEGYIPLPLDTIFKAGQAIQTRGDAAVQQNDQIQTGLASMEALAPAHRQFVNNFVTDFKKQQNQLLDKFSGNTSDPDYIRESKRTNMQFAADPRLKVIQQTNDLYKAKEKIKDELDSKGIKYLDSNPNFTGVDSHGNLSNNVGQLRATDFDEKIDKSFQAQENAMESHGATRTNRYNLHRNLNSYLESWNTNPLIQEGLQFYKQKGYNDEQAKVAMVSQLNQSANKYIKDDKDHFYEQMAWEKSKFASEQAAKAKPATSPGLLDANQSPFVVEELGKDRISKIDQVIKNTNESGGIKKGTFTVPNTEENRKKYPNSIPKTAPDSYNYNGKESAELVVPSNSYNPDENKLLNEAREVLGNGARNAKGTYLSDRTILTTYKNALTKTQAVALSYHAPLNNEYRKSLTSLEFGDNLEHLGNDYIVITKDGKFKAGSSEANKALKDVKKVSAVGTNAAPVGDFTAGTIAAEGVDKDRNTVTIIKPMSSTIASHYKYSNKASSALLSEFNNSELVNNPSTDRFKIQDKDGVVYAPQKGVTRNGSIGIAYYPIVNGKVDKSATPIDIDSMEQGEHANFFSKLGQSINTKAEDQNYQ